MRFLLDENTAGFDKRLMKLGHQVEYVTELKKKDEKFRNDFNVIMFAKENGMILVTKDKEPGKACEDNKIPCIWLSDDRVFDEMISPRLKNLEHVKHD